MSKTQRLIRSLVSLLIAAAVGGLGMALNDVRYGRAFSVDSCFWYSVFTFVFGLVGWTLALPIVLTITSVQGWRFWSLLALGTGIGPLVVFALAVYSAISSSNYTMSYAPEAKNIVFVALAVSFMTTLIYLVLLRLPRVSLEA